MNYIHVAGGALEPESGVKRPALFDPLLVEIANALLHLGGSAHRDQVIDRVAIARGLRAAPEELQDDLAYAFEHHLQGAAGHGETAILILPFGEGSRRWSLTPEAYDSLRITRRANEPKRGVERARTPARPLQSAAVFDFARARAAVKQGRRRRSKANPAPVVV